MSTTTATRIAYRVCRWFDLYEVNNKNDVAQPGQKLRQSPLPFARWYVHGRSQGAGYRRLAVVCGSSTKLMAAYAVFGKLLELAADNEPRLRGWIVNEQGEPATLDDLVFFTGFPAKAIEQSLLALSHPNVGWIQMVDMDASPEVSGNAPGNPDAAGENQSQYNETEYEYEYNSTQPKAPRETAEAGSGSVAARSRVSDSGSGDSAKVSSARLKAHAKYAAIIDRLQSPDKRQGKADRTNARRLWDEVIWPKGITDDIGAEQFARFVKLVERSADADNRMAWINHQIGEVKL